MDDVLRALQRMGLLEAGQRPPLEPLPGGVSSDIWRVDLATGPACIKRALPRLRVSAEWHAPVERNRYELEWMRCVARIMPEAVPEILGADDEQGLFVMRYLDPAVHPLWKQQLSEGIAETTTAARVGERLARIHAATAGDREVAARFATDETFFAIRLEPYLLATARAHPELAGPLESLVETTGLRPGFLSQSSAAQVPVGAPRPSSFPCLLPGARRCAYGAHGLGSAGAIRGAHGAVVAGVAARAGRRQVTGGVLDRRG
jgi:hypothetical protein